MAGGLLKGKLKTVKIDSVKQHPDNPRRGDEASIAESIDENDLYKPIVVQKSSQRILVGNHTWKVAKAEGLKEIHVWEIDVDDEHARRILLVDNRTNERASWKLPELVKFLEGMPDLKGTGFAPIDLTDFTKALTDVPKPFSDPEEGPPPENECPRCKYTW